MAIQPRRVGRHGDHSCVQATEEGGDVLEPRREDEESALANRATRLEPCSERTRLLVELRVRQAHLVGAPGRDEGVRGSFRLSLCPRAEQLDQGRRLKISSIGLGHSAQLLLEACSNAAPITRGGGTVTKVTKSG